jgi:hypothetical protein
VVREGQQKGQHGVTSWALSSAGLIEYETIDFNGDDIQGARFQLNAKGRAVADRLLTAIRLPTEREPRRKRATRPGVR